MIRASTLLFPAILAATPAGAGDLPLPPERTGLLYVSGALSDNVGEYLPDGTLLRTFTAPGLSQPRGVAVDDHGNVVVVSSGSDRIFVFDLEGAVVREVAHPDLTSGTGLSRSADGSWYVGNFSPGRILVFDRDWDFRGKIEVAGMSGVNCVSFDAGGGFAATDAVHHVVHLFDATHQHVGTVQSSSFLSPMSIAMDSEGSHFVSNGSSGVVVKFDAAWGHVTTFGAGTLSAPQGIAIDAEDTLTISNFSAQTVHRYDKHGVLLSSFPLVGVTVGRNLAWQTSPYALARVGTVDAANGHPQRVLTVNGSTGDALGRVSLPHGGPIQIEIAAPPSGPGLASLVLYAISGEPSVGDVTELPFGAGPFAFATPLSGGTPATLVNSIGHTSILGQARFAAAHAPGVVLSLANGVPGPTTVTLQAILEDAGSAGSTGFSATNALVLDLY